MGIPLKGESEVTEYVTNQRYVEKSKGGIDSTWTWTFKPEAQRTLLNLVIEYTIPIPVLGKIGERLVMRQNEREADVALAYVKDKLEG
jgi:predicted GNAT family acetyltransferase